MDKLTSALYSSLESTHHSSSNIDIVVAYSGGVDSQVLLHALIQLKKSQHIPNNITVCHVNHGLSVNAERWEKLAQQTCADLSVHLIIKRVDIKAKVQQSLEAIARDARYNALRELSDKPSLILTGHHGDDQSETFLLALKRGAGLKGLSAMSENTSLGIHRLVRPLLAISRQEIESYAKEHKINWIEDESNTDTSFDRNYFRQEVMPMLRQRWPSISNTINRSAEHCLAGQELLDELAEQDLKACRLSENSMAVEYLSTLSQARFNNLLRYFMSQHHCLMPSTQQIKQVREQLSANADKTPQIKVGDCYFRRFNNALYLTLPYADVSHWQVKLERCDTHGLAAQSEVILPDNLGVLVLQPKEFEADVKASDTGNNEDKSNNIDNVIFDDKEQLPAIALPAHGQQVNIRFSHENPKCLPHYREHSRSVKKVLQELTIPPWERKRIAFLYYDNDLVAALGYFVCKAFIAKNSEARLHISHQAS